MLLLKLVSLSSFTLATAAFLPRATPPPPPVGTAEVLFTDRNSKTAKYTVPLDNSTVILREPFSSFKVTISGKKGGSCLFFKGGGAKKERLFFMNAQPPEGSSLDSEGPVVSSVACLPFDPDLYSV